MSKSGKIIYSKNIFLSNELDKFEGYIVINNEKIEELIPEYCMSESKFKEL